MLFLNIETQEYPRHQGDLELLGWALGDQLPAGWVEVQPEGYPPGLPDGSKIVEEYPVKDGDTWKQSFKIVAMTQGEIQNSLAMHHAINEGIGKDSNLVIEL
jgi:hypothetical protein